MRYWVRGIVCVAAVSVAAGPVMAAPAGRLSEARYRDKVLGAWLGKCIGGALGMPLEGWRYWDIAKKHPRITGYLGYFSDAWVGWSGIHDAARIPTDGQWHPLRVAVKVPAFDAERRYAVPIVGLSLEYSTAPAAYEMRSLRTESPKAEVPFDATTWDVSSACTWASGGVAKFDFQGERAWLKLKPEEGKRLALAPGGTLELSFEARWLSGDDRIGFSFDYRSREMQKGFGPDDDTSYQIVGLHALETLGPDLSCKQLGKAWCDLLPAISPSLAEGLALERMRKGIAPPESGQHPIGEAIGGQMKGELWGLVCPGRPDLAAEYARRDGVVAHCKNGVYGEQFASAMMAAAFQEKDVRKLIDAGLQLIPADSQYAGVVREAVALHAKHPDYREPLRIVVEKYPGICDPVYSEAGIVTLALLYGGGDFEKSICIAASCGNDTDCDTATVGALLGCVYGAKALPARWKEPIGDEFRCFVRGLEKWRITDLARRVCAQGRRVLKHHGKGMRFSSDL